MVKLVIWKDLNAQSVCMYQIWIFLILWCSTSWEESRDYKFVIFGSTEQKIWIYQANRRFDSNLKIVSNWTHKIWSFIVLRDSRSLKDSNEILFVIFRVTDQKLWFFKDLDQIRFQTSIRFFVLTRSWHVADSGWLITIRLDLGSGPSDLKEIGRSKSFRTRSVSDLFWATRSRSDGPQRKERESLQRG
jgi:hypothetical protein